MFRDFFKGRYGMDNLTITLLVVTVIFFNNRYLGILSLALATYAIFRIFSKDIYKRKLELQWFNKVVYSLRQSLMPLTNKYTMYVTRMKQRKIFVFLKCPNCKNTLRLPRNKGKISITCPKCKREFVKKT